MSPQSSPEAEIPSNSIPSRPDDEGQLTPDCDSPLLLLFFGRPPLCVGCDTVLPPRFCGVELYYQDGTVNPFRVLAPVCSPVCQKLLIDESHAVGMPEGKAWPHQKLRSALDDPDQFAGVIDLSHENIVRVALDTILAAVFAAKSGQIV
jgi:hypothetical protein